LTNERQATLALTAGELVRLALGIFARLTMSRFHDASSTSARGLPAPTERHIAGHVIAEYRVRLNIMLTGRRKAEYLSRPAVDIPVPELGCSARQHAGSVVLPQPASEQQKSRP
jgi:hypothetical protein